MKTKKKTASLNKETKTSKTSSKGVAIDFSKISEKFRNNFGRGYDAFGKGFNPIKRGVGPVNRGFTPTSKKGFTLMEIIVVMAIMGILAVVAMGSYMASLRKSRNVKRKAEVASVTKALELYFQDFGAYPAANAGLIQGCGAGGIGNCDWGDPFTNTTTGVVYMAKLPEDPKGNQTYVYDSGQIAGTNQWWFKLFARLEVVNNADPDDMQWVDLSSLAPPPICNATATDPLDQICNFGISSSNVAIDVDP